MSRTRLHQAARVCLVLTAWSIPLSTSGMQIGIGGLLGLALMTMLTGDGVVRRTPLDGPLALCFATFAVSTLVSGAPWQAVGWSRPWVVIAYYGVYWWLPDRAAAERFVTGLLRAALLVAVYAIVQHLTGADWYRELLGRAREVEPRIAGASGYASVGFFKNYLTFAHVMIVPLGFALGREVSWQRAVSVVSSSAAIFVSTARGAWIAAVAMLGVSLRRGVGWTAVAVLAVVGMAWTLLPGLRAQVIPSLSQAPMNAGRIGIYRANLDIVRDHPVFGLGFGRYRTAAKPYYARHPEADRRSHAHNNFLQIAAEAGLVGLGAFTLLLAMALRFAVDAVTRCRGTPFEGTARGACVALVGFLVGGLTQYTFGDNEVATAMWATVAIAMRLREG